MRSGKRIRSLEEKGTLQKQEKTIRRPGALRRDLQESRV